MGTEIMQAKCQVPNAKKKQHQKEGKKEPIFFIFLFYLNLKRKMHWEKREKDIWERQIFQKSEKGLSKESGEGNMG